MSFSQILSQNLLLNVTFLTGVVGVFIIVFVASRNAYLKYENLSPIYKILFFVGWVLLTTCLFLTGNQVALKFLKPMLSHIPNEHWFWTTLIPFGVGFFSLILSIPLFLEIWNYVRDDE